MEARVSGLYAIVEFKARFAGEAKNPGRADSSLRGESCLGRARRYHITSVAYGAYVLAR